MIPPLSRLLDTGRVATVGAASIDAFVEKGPCLLFFTGDAERRVETSDVAVVLRELVGGDARLRVAMIAREDEDALARRFGVEVTPSVVEVRQGAPRGVAPKIQSWSTYAGMASRVVEGGGS